MADIVTDFVTDFMTDFVTVETVDRLDRLDSRQVETGGDRCRKVETAGDRWRQVEIPRSSPDPQIPISPDSQIPDHHRGVTLVVPDVQYSSVLP